MKIIKEIFGFVIFLLYIYTMNKILVIDKDINQGEFLDLLLLKLEGVLSFEERNVEVHVMGERVAINLIKDILNSPDLWTVEQPEIFEDGPIYTGPHGIKLKIRVHPRNIENHEALILDFYFKMCGSNNYSKNQIDDYVTHFKIVRKREGEIINHTLKGE